MNDLALVSAEEGALFPLPDPVLAASAWADNGALVRDCARLGYLRQEWRTLDPTYGRGGWWTRFRPDELVMHDKFTLDGVDFRNLPEPDASFDAVAYDPPYIAPGGRDKSTVADFNDRFGLHTTPPKPADLQELINDGLTEMRRVVKPRGFVLVKCCDYVNGGKLWFGTHFTVTHAFELGFVLEDRLYHLGGTGPQSQTTQKHARSNLSTLFVLKARA